MIKPWSNFCEHGYNLKPLLVYRNYLKDMAVDKTTRHIIRRKGETTISLYTIETRIDLLKRLLQAQKEADTQLIRPDELKAIDRLWRADRAPVTVKQVCDSV